MIAYHLNTYYIHKYLIYERKDACALCRNQTLDFPICSHVHYFRNARRVLLHLITYLDFYSREYFLPWAFSPANLKFALEFPKFGWIYHDYNITLVSNFYRIIFYTISKPYWCIKWEGENNSKLKIPKILNDFVLNIADSNHSLI